MNEDKARNDMRPLEARYAVLVVQHAQLERALTIAQRERDDARTDVRLLRDDVERLMMEIAHRDVLVSRTQPAPLDAPDAPAAYMEKFRSVCGRDITVTYAPGSITPKITITDPHAPVFVVTPVWPLNSISDEPNPDGVYIVDTGASWVDPLEVPYKEIELLIRELQRVLDSPEMLAWARREMHARANPAATISEPASTIMGTA